MKKIITLFSFLVLFTAFTCENEPLEGEFGDGGGTNSSLSCADASQNLVTATTNFAGVAPDDTNYTQLCLAYTSALEDQIEACGDDGTIQAIIDSLGTCGDNDLTAECEAASIVAAQAETAYNNDNTNEDLCNVYKTALQNQMTTCGDATGSIQTIIDGLGDCNVTNQNNSILFVSMGGVDVDFDIISVVVEDNLIKVNGDSTFFTSHHLYIEVNPDETGVNTFVTFELSTALNTLVPYIEGTSWDFASEVTTNSTGILVGTFGGTVVNSSGGGVDLTGGVIDVSY